jgi:hypothetical protein
LIVVVAGSALRFPLAFMNRLGDGLTVAGAFGKGRQRVGSSRSLALQTVTGPAFIPAQR